MRNPIKEPSVWFVAAHAAAHAAQLSPAGQGSAHSATPITSYPSKNSPYTAFQVQVWRTLRCCVRASTMPARPCHGALPTVQPVRSRRSRVATSDAWVAHTCRRRGRGTSARWENILTALDGTRPDKTRAVVVNPPAPAAAAAFPTTASPSPAPPALLPSIPSPPVPVHPPYFCQTFPCSGYQPSAPGRMAQGTYTSGSTDTQPCGSRATRDSGGCLSGSR